MTPITKKSLIEGRPYFSSNEENNSYATSFFTKNSRFKKLDPSISPSKIHTFFRKLWKSAAPYFSIQHSNSVKENIKEAIRPLEKENSQRQQGIRLQKIIRDNFIWMLF